MALRDSDLLVGVGGENNANLDRDTLFLPPLVFDGEVEESDKELEMDEGISSEEIVDLLSKASQGLVHSENDNENNIPPLDPVEEESDSEDEIESCIDY